MKSIIKYLNLGCCIGLTAAVTALAEPTPSATSTPHSEPSASPTPSGTPHQEPTPTPTATPDGDHDHGEVSLRGVYGATTPSGGLIVFCIEKNTFVQINMLDIAGQVIGFAEGPLSHGSFSLTLTTGQAIVGTANENGIAFTLAGQPFQASRFATFGTDSTIAGRYFGVAHGPTGESQVMFIIDSNKHIIMIQRTGSVLTGGFGTVTPPASPTAPFTFTLGSFIGSTSPITGSFTITDGVFTGMFQTSAGTFTVNTFKNSLFNRMANISTRGLVGTGQGQLIGGFIITGGPKFVMIRAMGPSLAAAGVSPALANPSLALYAGSTQLAANDDWKTNANVADIIASGIAPADDLEAVLLIRLEPGAYTTVVSGAGGTTGIGLVEIYEVGSD
ncbi:MAG TPA: hypothetical protein VH188_14515 [Chthoniobacterales bacterium]|jgi:hypothetical protein|nr:hypothetical protein [Chthoniobacterales bacterium]